MTVSAVARRFPVKTVADTPGVIRPNLVDQLSHPDHYRRGPYCRAGGDKLTAEIRIITDTRPTCGYRYVSALLNRTSRATSELLVDRKRALRLI